MIRAVDLHVHLPLKEWLDGSMGPYREGAARYFRSDVHERTVECRDVEKRCRPDEVDARVRQPLAQVQHVRAAEHTDQAA